MAEEAKVERKLEAHFIGLTDTAGTTEWIRVGKDLEEFNMEMNPDTETSKNIIGETTFVHNGYELSGDVDTFYVRKGNALAERLQEIIDTQDTSEKCMVKYMDVQLWNSNKSLTWDAYIIPQSWGGDTAGYQIPFTIYPVGTPVVGSYDDTSTTAENTSLS